MIKVASHILLSGLPSTRPPDHIRAIVSLLTPPLSSYPTLSDLPPGTQHLHIPLSDTDDALLLPTLLQTLSFIDSHVRRGNTTLIHCMHGVSRSVATYLAYCIALGEHERRRVDDRDDRGDHNDHDENDGHHVDAVNENAHTHADTHSQANTLVRRALQHLRVRYASANPSANFMDQLVAFASMCVMENACNTLPTTHTRRDNTSYSSMTTSTRLQNLEFPPTAGTNGVPNAVANTILRLAAVTPASNLPAVCMTTPQTPAVRDVLCNTCTTTLLPANAVLEQQAHIARVLPVDWMAPACVQARAGRLHCPGCGTRVGFHRIGHSGGVLKAEFTVALRAVRQAEGSAFAHLIRHPR